MARLCGGPEHERERFTPYGELKYLQDRCGPIIDGRPTGWWQAVQSTESPKFNKISTKAYQERELFVMWKVLRLGPGSVGVS